MLDFPYLSRIFYIEFLITQDRIYILETIAYNYLLRSNLIFKAWGKGLKMHNDIKCSLMTQYLQTHLQSQVQLHANGHFVCTGGCFRLCKSSFMGTSTSGPPWCQSCSLQTQDTTQPYITKESATSRIRQSVQKSMHREMSLLGPLPQPQSRQIAALERLQVEWTDTLVRDHWDIKRAALRDSLTGELLDQDKLGCRSKSRNRPYSTY